MDIKDTDWRRMARETASGMRERMQAKGVAAPAWAIVLGSGLQEPAYFDPGSPILEWDFAEIPCMPDPSVPGHRGSLQVGNRTQDYSPEPKPSSSTVTSASPSSA